MKGKVGAIAACLLFAVCFGGVGVFGSWAIGTTVRDWWAARDWIAVPAKVTAYSLSSTRITYEYTVDGRKHTGHRFDVTSLENDDPSDAGEAKLQAVSGGRPVSVFVDPTDASRAVFERAMPWRMMLFMTPFAFAFGGVGVGALWMMWKVVRDDDAKPAQRSGNSDAAGKALGAWVATFFWNVISFPIAIIAVPELWAEGEYWGLFVLIFPAVGLLLVWGAVWSTIELVRYGGARLTLSSANPRAGSALQGFVAFPRGVTAGENFRVRLACNATSGTGKLRKTTTRWFREQVARASEVGGNVRLPFRFEIAAEAPGTQPSGRNEAEIAWRLEATSTDRKGAVPAGFELNVAVASPEALASAAAHAEEAEPGIEPLRPELARFEHAAEQRGTTLGTEGREALAKMTPGQRELVAKALDFAPKARKIVVWVVVAVVGVQILGAIAAVTGLFFSK